MDAQCQVDKKLAYYYNWNLCKLEHVMNLLKFSTSKKWFMFYLPIVVVHFYSFPGSAVQITCIIICQRVLTIVSNSIPKWLPKNEPKHKHRMWRLLVKRLILVRWYYLSQCIHYFVHNLGCFFFEYVCFIIMRQCIKIRRISKWLPKHIGYIVCG